MAYPPDDSLHSPTSDNSSPMSVHSLPATVYPYTPGLVAAPIRAKRRQCRNACQKCQKACKKCDDARPCLRCIRYGITDECVDSPRKERKKGIKRGPYKKRDGKGNADIGEPTNGAPPFPPTAALPAGLTSLGPSGYLPGYYSNHGDQQDYHSQYYHSPVPSQQQHIPVHSEATSSSHYSSFQSPHYHPSSYPHPYNQYYAAPRADAHVALPVHHHYYTMPPE